MTEQDYYRALDAACEEAWCEASDGFEQAIARLRDKSVPVTHDDVAYLLKQAYMIGYSQGLFREVPEWA